MLSPAQLRAIRLSLIELEIILKNSLSGPKPEPGSLAARLATQRQFAAHRTKRAIDDVSAELRSFSKGAQLDDYEAPKERNTRR